MAGYFTRKRKRDLESLVQQTISFLDLPPEIRNQIYHAVLVPGEGLLVPQRSSALSLGVLMEPGLEYDFSHYYTCDTSILRLCKMVHNEAAHVLYSMNNFAVYQVRPWLSLLDFLQTIGPRNRSSLRRLRCCLPSRSEHYKRIEGLKRIDGKPPAYQIPLRLNRKQSLVETAPFLQEFEAYLPQGTLDRIPFALFYDPAMIDCAELLADANLLLKVEAADAVPADLPNQMVRYPNIPVEARALNDCCKQFSKDPLVKVLWTYHPRRDYWESQRSKAEQCGWEIVEETEYRDDFYMNCKVTLRMASSTAEAPDFSKRKRFSHRDSFIYDEKWLK